MRRRLRIKNKIDEFDGNLIDSSKIVGAKVIKKFA